VEPEAVSPELSVAQVTEMVTALDWFDETDGSDRVRI